MHCNVSEMLETRVRTLAGYGATWPRVRASAGVNLGTVRRQPRSELCVSCRETSLEAVMATQTPHSSQTTHGRPATTAASQNGTSRSARIRSYPAPPPLATPTDLKPNE